MNDEHTTIVLKIFLPQYNTFKFMVTYICFAEFRPNCVKNDPCDVNEIREMRGEVGKKTPQKKMDNTSFS